MALADDYVSVAQRVGEFLVKYPDGSIQTEIHTHTDTLVVVKATAYRTADDQRPTTGFSQLGIPGKTNFTRDSEIENCETSAVGRALAFMGFSTHAGLASREDIENKREAPPSRPPRQQAKPAAPQAPPPGVSADGEIMDDGSFQEPDPLPEWYNTLKGWLLEHGWNFNAEPVRDVLNRGTAMAEPDGVIDAVKAWRDALPPGSPPWGPLIKRQIENAAHDAAKRARAREGAGP